MTTKLKKYIKFAICCMLIIGLMSPIYATSKSVDGDSFVTKEEVDKAISDFNKRLQSFEAGINSKIDTQITTYLDRNGIWSARNQTLINGFSLNNAYELSSRTDTAHTSDNWIKLWSTEGASVTLTTPAEWKIDNYKLAIMDKTGLLVLNYQFFNECMYHMNTSGIKFTEGTATGDEKTWEAGIGFTHITPGTTIAFDSNIGYYQQIQVLSSKSEATSVTISNVTAKEAQGTVSFFVSQKEEVHFLALQRAFCNEGTLKISNATTDSTKVQNYCGVYKLLINSIVVY